MIGFFIGWAVVIVWLCSVWFCVYGWRLTIVPTLQWVLDKQAQMAALAQLLSQCQGDDIPDDEPKDILPCANDCAD